MGGDAAERVRFFFFILEWVDDLSGGYEDPGTLCE